MGASFQLEFYSWEQIMIAKITLVSMLAAVALARPEADPYFYHHGVVGHVHPTCEQGVDTLEVQTCAPRVDQVCVEEDVMSEEITYEKRCKEVVSKTCSPVIVKRSAEAEPEADPEADPQFWGGYGHHYGYAAPHVVALPELKTKTIETPCAEHTTEHCVDVPIIKEVFTPVKTCHDVTKVDCTPADHNIAKVTCTPGSTTVTDLAATYGLVHAAPAPAAVPAAVDA